MHNNSTTYTLVVIRVGTRPASHLAHCDLSTRHTAPPDTTDWLPPSIQPVGGGHWHSHRLPLPLTAKKPTTQQQPASPQGQLIKFVYSASFCQPLATPPMKSIFNNTTKGCRHCRQQNLLPHEITFSKTQQRMLPPTEFTPPAEPP
jgi:hypothetical protein